MLSQKKSVAPFEKRNYLLFAFMLLTILVSAIGVKDYFTYFLETVPVAVGALIVVLGRFRITQLLCVLIAVHSVVLCLGGHYTYAEVPLGFWMKDAFGFARNHYDRIGHLAQGFIPAILAREILIRKGVVNGKVWLFVFVTTICLAFSAFYEMIEWWTALATGEAADAFLGTQGDPWDTQWDMFFALVGALLAQLLLSRLHDKELREIRSDAG